VEGLRGDHFSLANKNNSQYHTQHRLDISGLTYVFPATEKGCHPELVSGSIEQQGFSPVAQWMLKQVQHDNGEYVSQITITPS
jgi:hypothetical protein